MHQPLRENAWVQQPRLAQVRPDKPRQLPDMTAKWTQTWSFLADQENSCFPLKCGMPDTFIDGEACVAAI